MIKKLNSNKYKILAFFIPIIFFSLIFLVGMYPFGTSSLCPVDAIHQYIPFLEEFKYKIQNGESFFFSLRAGSCDFYLLWLYYLTSPFNLLVFLFDDVIIAFSIIIILKISCISLSMSYYLSKIYKKNDLSIAVFAICYALSGYVMAYYYSTLWLDELILFPWLIYSFKLIIENKKTYLYPLLLALTIFSNFFMAIHICIFLCIYFILQNFDNIKDFFIKLLRFFLYSLLGGGMAAMFYIPFLSIGSGKFKKFPTCDLLTNFADLFLSLGDTCNKNISMSYASNANIFCGVTTLMFFTLYILNKRIPIRDRIRNLVIIILLFLTMNITTLDYIFNGFYQPVGYMGRYSYIFIFFMVCCAYEEFTYFRKISNKQFLIAALILSGAFFICYIYKFVTKDVSATLLFSSSITFFMIGLLVITKLFLKDKKSMIYLYIVIEIFITGIYQFPIGDVSDFIEHRNSFDKIAFETSDRQIIDNSDSYNEEIFNNMTGLSFFSSTIGDGYLDFSLFMNKLGMGTGRNFVSAFGHTPVTDILFNLKYIYSEEDSNYVDYKKIDEADNYSVFENIYNTSYGYIVPKSILECKFDDINPFINLNEFVQNYFNDDNMNVYHLVDNDKIDVESNFNNDIKKNTKLGINFSNCKNAKISYSMTAEQNNLCININNSDIEKYEIYVNDKLKVSNSYTANRIISLYDIKKGDKIRVEVEFCKNDGIVYCNMAYFDNDSFTKFAKDISNNRVEIDEIGDRISGTYTYKEDSVMILSIPCSKGWEGTSINSDLGLIVMEINSSGQFEINYVTPFFNIGLLVSLMSTVIYLQIIKRNLKSYVFFEHFFGII